MEFIWGRQWKAPYINEQGLSDSVAFALLQNNEAPGKALHLGA